MKKIIYLLAIGTYALFLTGCVPPDDDNNFEPQTITPVLIAKGENCFAENLSGINMVIKTDEAWNALLDTLSSVTDSFIETEIDFAHYMALAVIEEVKGNGGWSIDITGVTEHANKIVVAYTNLETGDATEVISQPYHIVKIPKSGKGVLFERTENGGKEEILLVNTSWKLAGMVDAETGVLTELEPEDCNECYTFAFDTDSAFN